MINFPYISLVLFIASMLFTPGPNNTMLAISGARFGLSNSWQHIFGVTIGFSIMIALLGIGLGKLMEQFQVMEWALNIGSLIFIAWYIYTVIYSEPPKDLKKEDPKSENGNTSKKSFFNLKKPRSKPLNFFQATLFQWINIKAWIVGLAALGQFLRPNTYFEDLYLVCGSFFVIGMVSATVWCYFGTMIGRLLKTVVMYRIFNLIMGLLLILSVVPLYIDKF